MPDTSVSRRDLARHVVASAAATLVGTSVLAAGDDPAGKGGDAGRPETMSPLDVQMEWLFQRYPAQHLTDDEIAAVRRDVGNRLEQLEMLRQYPLDFGDVPAQVFAAYRRDG